MSTIMINKNANRDPGRSISSNSLQGTISMNIYLYKKTHNITGLQYLGKTKQNPFKYKGSGKYWTNHLNCHGNDVTTEIIRICFTNQELKEWGLYYSQLWNIVDSNQWANLIEETGSGGDTSYCDAYKQGITNRKLRGIRNPMYGKTHTDVSRLNMSQAKKGKLPSNIKLFTQSATNTVWCYNPITCKHKRIKKGSSIPKGYTIGRPAATISNKTTPRKSTPVHCVELNKDFLTVKSAAEFVNLKCPRDIIDSIIGRSGRKTAAGYHWRFIVKDTS